MQEQLYVHFAKVNCAKKKVIRIKGSHFERRKRELLPEGSYVFTPFSVEGCSSIHERESRVTVPHAPFLRLQHFANPDVRELLKCNLIHKNCI